MVAALLGSAALSAASGIASAVGKKRLAKDQMARSQDLRTEAYGVRKPALRPEFQSALQAAKLRTLYGLPNSGAMKDELDLELATNLGRGKSAATSGGELLQYASSLGAEGSRLKRDINLTDSTMRDQNFGGYMNTLWNVGNEELKNVAIQREERNKLLGQAGALENAATANKFAGNTEIASSIFNAGAQGLGGLANQAGGAAGKTGVQAQSVTPNDTEATRFDYNQSGLQFDYANPQGVQAGMVTVISPEGKVARIPITQLNNYMKLGYTKA